MFTMCFPTDFFSFRFVKKMTSCLNAIFKYSYFHALNILKPINTDYCPKPLRRDKPNFKIMLLRPDIKYQQLLFHDSSLHYVQETIGLTLNRCAKNSGDRLLNTENKCIISDFIFSDFFTFCYHKYTVAVRYFFKNCKRTCTRTRSIDSGRYLTRQIQIMSFRWCISHEPNNSLLRVIQTQCSLSEVAPSVI